MFLSVKTITKLNLGQGETLEIKIIENSRRGSHCPDNAELLHVAVVLRTVKNVPRIITHVHSHCSAR